MDAPQTHHHRDKPLLLGFLKHKNAQQVSMPPFPTEPVLLHVVCWVPAQLQKGGRLQPLQGYLNGCLHFSGLSVFPHYS